MPQLSDATYQLLPGYGLGARLETQGEIVLDRDEDRRTKIIARRRQARTAAGRGVGESKSHLTDTEDLASAKPPTESVHYTLPLQ